MPLKEYSFIDHSADIGIEVYGEDLKELFINAAFALFDIITEITKVTCKAQYLIKIEGYDNEQLLIRWLNELIYRFEVDEMLFKKFEIISLNENMLEALASGEKIDKNIHKINKKIKAATYHNLNIRKINNKFVTTIIFDV